MRLVPGSICLCRSSPTIFNPHPDVVETLAFWRCAVKQRPASEPPKRNRRSSESPIQQFWLLVFFRKIYEANLSPRHVIRFQHHPSNTLRPHYQRTTNIAPTLPQLGNLHHRAEYRCPSIHSLKNKSWWSTRLSADFHRLWSSHL